MNAETMALTGLFHGEPPWPRHLLDGLLDPKHEPVSTPLGKGAGDWLASVGGRRYDSELMATRKPPAIEWIFPGMKPAIVKSLVSTGGTGKSFLALGLGASVASGHDLLGLFSAWGHRIRRGRVVFLALEDDEETVHHRLHDIASSAQGLSPKDLRMLDVVGIPGGIDILNPAHEKGIASLCSDAALVVVDTLRMLHEGDENSSSDMRRVMSAMTRCARSTGAGILFLHHSSKNAALSGFGDNQHASRGSSVIIDNSRGSYFVQTMTEEEGRQLGITDDTRHQWMRLGMGKENLGARSRDIWLRRDEHGIPRAQAVTAATVAPSNIATPRPSSQEPPRHKGRQVRA